MGVETSAEHGGAGASFTSAIVVIEELAKVDPSVSVLCDVHNTLVNTIFRTYGTDKQRAKWLPMLSENKVPGSCSSSGFIFSLPFSLDLSACRSPRVEAMPLRYKPVP